MPLAEILVLLGFFMIYIVEEVVHHGMDWYYGKYLAKVSIRSRYMQHVEVMFGFHFEGQHRQRQPRRR